MQGKKDFLSFNRKGHFKDDPEMELFFGRYKLPPLQHIKTDQINETRKMIVIK